MLRRILLSIVTWSTLGQLFAQGDRFFVTTTDGDLYKVHVLSCSAVLVGPTGQSFSDIALTSSGELYGRDSGALYRIDTSDATSVLVDTCSFIGNSLVALNDTTLLTVAYQRLYAIKTTDASATLIDTVGFSPLGDLTWFGGQLFMSTSGQLMRIDSEDNWASILSVTQIGIYDSMMPSCEGLSTNMVSDTAWSIVGFRPPNLICFSPTDGTYQTICQPPIPEWVPGAAAEPPTETPGGGCIVAHIGVGEMLARPAVHIQVINGQLEVTVPSDQKVEAVRLTDISGKLVCASRTLRPTGAVINLSGLTYGLYALEIWVGNTRIVERFINPTQE